MAKKKEPEVPAIVTIEGEREKTIALLSQHFAQDNLSLEELEKRIDLAYKAPTIARLREITRDLTGEPPAGQFPAVSAPAGGNAVSAVADYPLEYERINAIMSETKRTGPWRPAKKTRLRVVMSETTIDLTQATLQPGVTEFDIFALMASVKVIVPPGVRVVLQPSAFMASVSDETMDPPPVGSGAPVVRITGFVMMTELTAVVRRREQLGPGE